MNKDTAWITRRVQDCGPWLNRNLPDIRGKGRLIAIWRRLCCTGGRDYAMTSGMCMHLDLSIPYEASIWLGTEESHEIGHLYGILGDGEVFVDVGANIGLWTLSAASAVGPRGRVLAFEATQPTAARLAEHVALNGLGANVEVHNIALGEVAGVMPMDTSANHNRNRIIGSAEAVSQAGWVPVDTLDRVIGNRSVNGIKIDVEGYELQVLRGARNVVARCRPWICVEFNVAFTGVANLEAWSVHQWLGMMGYVRSPILLSRASIERVPPAWCSVGYDNLIYWHQDDDVLLGGSGT